MKEGRHDDGDDEHDDDDDDDDDDDERRLEQRSKQAPANPRVRSVELDERACTPRAPITCAAHLRVRHVELDERLAAAQRRRERQRALVPPKRIVGQRQPLQRRRPRRLAQHRAQRRHRPPIDATAVKVQAAQPGRQRAQRRAQTHERRLVELRVVREIERG